MCRIGMCGISSLQLRRNEIHLGHQYPAERSMYMHLGDNSTSSRSIGTSNIGALMVMRFWGFRVHQQNWCLHWFGVPHPETVASSGPLGDGDCQTPAGLRAKCMHGMCLRFEGMRSRAHKRTCAPLSYAGAFEGMRNHRCCLAAYTGVGWQTEALHCCVQHALAQPAQITLLPQCHSTALLTSRPVKA